MISDDLQHTAEAEADYDALLDAARDYLMAVGWEPIIIGGVAIEHRPLDYDQNYSLVVRFTSRVPQEEKK